MKYLRRYSTLNDYISDFLDLKSLPAYVSLVDDEDSMIGKDSQKKTVFVKSTGSTAWVGDLLAWDTLENKWAIINRDDIGEFDDEDTMCIPGFDMDRYIPDAICVIPACHMDDGKARWCALRDCDDNKNYLNKNRIARYATTLPLINPKIEIDDEGGQSNAPRPLLNLNYYQALPCVQIETLVIDEDPEISLFGTSIINYFIPNNKYCSISIPTQHSRYYNDCYDVMYFEEMEPKSNYVDNKIYLEFEDNLLYIDLFYTGDGRPSVSPFLYGDGTYENKKSGAIKKYKDAFIPYYYADNMYYNGLYDINNGYKNTKYLIEYYYTNQDVIQQRSGIILAYNYKLNEISNGMWYIPTIGELIYLVNRFYTIQQSLQKLQVILNPPTKWPVIFKINTKEDSCLQSSTLFSDRYAYCLNIYMMYVLLLSVEGHNTCIRPFRVY